MQTLGSTQRIRSGNELTDYIPGDYIVTINPDERHVLCQALAWRRRSSEATAAQAKLDEHLATVGRALAAADQESNRCPTRIWTEGLDVPRAIVTALTHYFSDVLAPSIDTILDAHNQVARRHGTNSSREANFTKLAAEATITSALAADFTASLIVLENPDVGSRMHDNLL